MGVETTRGGLCGTLQGFNDACIAGVFPELGTHLDKLEIGFSGKNDPISGKTSFAWGESMAEALMQDQLST